MVAHGGRETMGKTVAPPCGNSAVSLSLCGSILAYVQSTILAFRLTIDSLALAFRLAIDSFALHLMVNAFPFMARARCCSWRWLVGIVLVRLAGVRIVMPPVWL